MTTEHRMDPRKGAGREREPDEYGSRMSTGAERVRDMAAQAAVTTWALTNFGGLHVYHETTERPSVRCRCHLHHSTPKNNRAISFVRLAIMETRKTGINLSQTLIIGRNSIKQWYSYCQHNPTQNTHYQSQTPTTWQSQPRRLPARHPCP